MKHLSPAEQKEKQRQIKGIVINLVIASLIIAFSIISTFFEFKNVASQIVIAGFIVAASLLCLFLLVRWMQSLDEYESHLNSKACTVALYSSLFYLPIQYLSEVGLFPELHAGILFLGVWLTYSGACIYYTIKKSH